MLSRKRELFSPAEGVCALLGETDRWLRRGADFSDASLLDERGRLAFRSLMLRADDVALAYAEGSELSRKLEVRRSPLVQTGGLYSVGGTLYEATRAEHGARTSYLYLSEVAGDGTCELIAEDDSYDDLRQRRATETSRRVHCRRVVTSAVRSVAGGTDRLAPSMRIRVRASDYAGERSVRRDGVRYAVTSASGQGRWADLALAQLAGRRR